MSTNLKFIKFWSFLFLDVKYWVCLNHYFKINNIKIKITSSNDLLGMPELLFKLINKNINNQLFISTIKKKNLTFNKTLNFFEFYNCFIFNSDSEVPKTNNSSYIVFTKNCMLFYSNYNIFSMTFYFKFSYSINITYRSLNKKLIEDSSIFLGLSSF